MIIKDEDIVSTSRESLEKFIRELHRVTTYVKIMSHIQCLVMMFFLRYMPFMIEQGKLYVATPPLYGLDLGKNKMRFFVDNREYVEYVQSLFCQTNTIADIDTKKSLSKTAIIQFLYSNIDYIKLLTHISNVFAIDTQFLEFLLYNKDLSFAKFKHLVEKTYVYTKVTMQNNTIMIHGLVGNLYQTVFFNDRLIHECQPIIDLINRDKKYYLLNGQKMTIGQIMLAFSEAEPKGHLTRYKGLGEMPEGLVGKTTIIPGTGRTLKQYTIADVYKETQFIADIQSDKSAFIRGIKIRREDIE